MTRLEELPRGGELAPGLPSLSPATIYATLELLDELGFARRLSTPGGTTVYDPARTPTTT